MNLMLSRFNKKQIKFNSIYMTSFGYKLRLACWKGHTIWLHAVFFVLFLSLFPCFVVKLQSSLNCVVSSSKKNAKLLSWRMITEEITL